MGFRSKRTVTVLRELERQKSRKKIFKIDLSWMKETQDFSFRQGKKLLQSIYFHQHYLYY
jgi:hypothetical protein